MKQLQWVLTIFLTAWTLASPASSEVFPERWSGLYFGFNVGDVQHSLDITDNQATTFNATIKQVSNPDFIGGLQLGYRRQIEFTQTAGVFGLEFSTHFTNNVFKQEYGSPFALYQLSSSKELKNLSLLQIVGGIGTGRALIFLTGGVSWTAIKGNMISMDGVPFFNSLNLSKQIIGTVFGAGIEYAFTPVLSARLKADIITPNAYVVFANTNNYFQVSNTVVQGTLGVNYQFG